MQWTPHNFTITLASIEKKKNERAKMCTTVLFD